MKRIIFTIFAVSAFLVSCQKSNEDKAYDLIKDRMGKVLYHPESYESVEIVIDSAFTPFDSPEFYENTLKVAKICLEIDQLEKEIKLAKSSMAIWSGPYQSAFGRNEYKEAKEKFEEEEKLEKEEAQEEIEYIGDEENLLDEED